MLRLLKAAVKLVSLENPRASSPTGLKSPGSFFRLLLLLFGRGEQRPGRGLHLPIVSLAPAEPGLGDEVAAAHRVHLLRIVNPGRPGAALGQAPTPRAQPKQRCTDH